MQPQMNAATADERGWERMVSNVDAPTIPLSPYRPLSLSPFPF